MADICGKCGKEVVEDAVRCGGFCSETVCRTCSGMTPDFFAELKCISQCIWVCPRCKHMLVNARFSNALISMHTANESLIEVIKEDVRASILAEIRTEFQAFKNVVETATPSTRQQPNRSFAKSKRRKFSEVIAEDDGMDTGRDNDLIGSNILIHGSNETDCDLVADTSSPDESSQFWLYAAGFANHVQSDRVTTLAQDKLGTNEVTAVMLVPKDKDPRTLNFISFEIGMPVALKEKALNTNLWPRGIRVREFQNVGFQRSTPESRMNVSSQKTTIKANTSTALV